MASGNFCGRDPEKHMVNRGFLNGPLCAIYGITAVFMTRYLYELQSSPVFLFLGCMIIATAVEWLAGHALERIGHGKWWDYSNKKWNMDGYICLQYSVLWGILGLLAMKIGNRLCFYSSFIQFRPVSCISHPGFSFGTIDRRCRRFLCCSAPHHEKKCRGSAL